MSSHSPDVDREVVLKFLRRHDIPENVINVDLLFSAVHEVLLKVRAKLDRKHFLTEEEKIELIIKEMGANIILVHEILAAYPPLLSLAENEASWLIRKITSRILRLGLGES